MLTNYTSLLGFGLGQQGEDISGFGVLIFLAVLGILIVGYVLLFILIIVMTIDAFRRNNTMYGLLLIGSIVLGFHYIAAPLYYFIVYRNQLPLEQPVPPPTYTAPQAPYTAIAPNDTPTAGQEQTNNNNPPTLP